jgi:hypothetical protein
MFKYCLKDDRLPFSDNRLVFSSNKDEPNEFWAPLLVISLIKKIKFKPQIYF